MPKDHIQSQLNSCVIITLFRRIYCLKFVMFKHRLDQTPNLIVVLHWFMLSFNGGYINAGGFMATGRFVSHVTGFATLFGVDLMYHPLLTALGILSVPVFFLAGAFIAGLLIDRPIHHGKKPHFDWVMGLSSLCLLTTTLVGEFIHVTDFGDTIYLKESYLFLVLLCLASGLQNAAMTSSSGSTVRTTHLTGLTTDLGIGLARILTFKQSDEVTVKEKRSIFLRTGSIFSFVLGSAAGALIFYHVGHLGFLLSAVIALYAAWHGRNAKIAPHKQINL